jgi:hypothetical protein
MNLGTMKTIYNEIDKKMPPDFEERMKLLPPIFRINLREVIVFFI